MEYFKNYSIKLFVLYFLYFCACFWEASSEIRRSNVDPGLMIEKCDRNNHKMIFRGSKVKLSKVLNDEDHLWCKHAKTLEIFALDSLTIDRNLTKPKNQSLSVILITNELILDGRRVIDLSGEKGVTFETAAENGTIRTPSGHHGAPGIPGENGGNFFGRYERLTKVGPNDFLIINVSGGDGGDGQNGGNGLDGENGKHAKREEFPSPYSELDSKMERLRNLELNLVYAYRYKNYLLHGKPGTPGGNGGHGGIGGLGGYPGFVDFTREEGDAGTIQILQEQGKRGKNGKGGLPGKGGKNGDAYQCTWRGVLADSIRWWDKCHFVSAAQDRNGLHTPNGKPGTEGGNSNGMRQPSKLVTQIDDFVTAQEMFERFVTANVQ